MGHAANGIRRIEIAVLTATAMKPVSGRKSIRTTKCPEKLTANSSPSVREKHRLIAAAYITLFNLPIDSTPFHDFSLSPSFYMEADRYREKLGCYALCLGSASRITPGLSPIRRLLNSELCPVIRPHSGGQRPRERTLQSLETGEGRPPKQNRRDRSRAQNDQSRPHQRVVMNGRFDGLQSRGSFLAVGMVRRLLPRRVVQLRRKPHPLAPETAKCTGQARSGKQSGRLQNGEVPG